MDLPLAQSCLYFSLLRQSIIRAGRRNVKWHSCIGIGAQDLEEFTHPLKLGQGTGHAWGRFDGLHSQRRNNNPRLSF